MAAGSICSMASSKYPSNEGRKSLSFDLLASRLFGHRFHSFVSSALLTCSRCSRSVYLPQLNVFRKHQDANNLLTITAAKYRGMMDSPRHASHNSSNYFKTYTTAIQYQKIYIDYRWWWWKLVCRFKTDVPQIHVNHCFIIQYVTDLMTFFNPLNTELKPICYLLALLDITIFSTLPG